MAEVIFTVVLEAAKCLGPPTEAQFNYVRNYTSNFENLKAELEKLKDESTSMQHKVDEAKRKGEEIETNVDRWVARVSEIVTDADKFVGDYEVQVKRRCFIRLCPNLKIRHQLSKEAVKKLEALVDLRDTGRGFDMISYRTAPEDIRLISSKDYMAFESRMSTLKDILDALSNPDVNLIGIYGMGGIGKTTLAKEVGRQVMRDQIFSEVVFVEVTQSQDIRKIQGEIADKLGLTFLEESESGRARSLYHRLKTEKKVLMILDNIWESLDLQTVGIPHGDDHKGCKILLTARSQDILLTKMDCEKNFSVGILNEEESWSLFKKMAGDYIEGSEFKSVAKDVAGECAGLPVSIITVARALRKKRFVEWKDSLQRLRRPFSFNYKDIQPAAYSAIELSYSKLEGEELKRLFLLIGSATVTSVEYLLIYAMGLGLFQGITMDEAQARVRTLVYKLKASCMLFEYSSKNDEHFFMHDVVRDVAIAIASTEQNVLTVTNELLNQREWLDESRVRLYTSIVLLDIKTNVLPEVLECPRLELLDITAQKSSSLTIPDKLFVRTVHLRVLSLFYFNLSSLPSSLFHLTNLQTLCLYSCELQDISAMGDLKNLEILYIVNCYIERLPVEIGQLTRLRSFSLKDCTTLKVIPPTVLSNLNHLEELHIHSFDKWGEEIEGLKNASLDELKHLPNLTLLELQVKDINTLPRDLFFWKLERYRISIGRWYWEETLPTCARTFRLQLNTNNCLRDGLIVQLQKIEDLCLSGLQDINKFFHELVKVGSSQLKHLWVEGCHAHNPEESKRCGESTSKTQSNEIILEDHVNALNTLFSKGGLPNLETLELCDVNIERIWKSQLGHMPCGIQNLTRLILYGCRELRCLFTSSIVSCFARLQHLEIDECPALEEIVVMDQKERDRKNIVFPELRVLKMIDLEKLTSFCTAAEVHIEFPSLESLKIIRCQNFMAKCENTTPDVPKEVLPNLKTLIVEGKKIPMSTVFPEDSFRKLKYLDINFEESTISSLDFLARFHKMKELTVRGGGYVGSVLPGQENWMTAIIRSVNKCCDLKHILTHEEANMSNLDYLVVEYCDHLINLVPSSTSFQNLTELVVWRCSRLINVLKSSTAKSMTRLRYMRIIDCKMMTEIMADDGGDAAAEDEIVFSGLMELTLCDLRCLTTFCSGKQAIKFPNLDFVQVSNCPDMKNFSGGEVSTPILHEIQVSDYDWTWKEDLNTTILQIHLDQEKLQTGGGESNSSRPSMPHQTVPPIVETSE